MNELLDISKQIEENGVLELEFIPKSEIQVVDERRLKIEQGKRQIELEKQVIWIQLDATDEELEKVRCNVDELDYVVAFSSGIVAGVVDSFLVGEWDFVSAKADANMKINEKVMKFAKKNGYKGERLAGAIKNLEGNNKLLGDDDWKGKRINVDAKSHHLDDLCHHPTLIGLLSCLIREFTRDAAYYNSKGEKHVIPLGVDDNGNLTGETVETKLFAGTVNWCMNVARNWKGHLYSDMAGCKTTAGGGMGIPGPLMSLFKELSVLPGISDSDWPQKLKAAYTKGIGDAKGQLDLGWMNVLFDGDVVNRMDLRTEKAVSSLLTKQSLPVLLNAVMVYAFYFFRQFVKNYKEEQEISMAFLKKCMGANDGATLVRMFTVASGTFSAIDMLDAAVHSGLNKKSFILRLNFVGIGAFAISVGTDAGICLRRERLLTHKKKLNRELMCLTNTELYYKEAEHLVLLTDLLEETESEDDVKKEELVVRTDMVLEKAEETPKKSILGFCNKKKKDKELLQEQLEHLNNVEDSLKVAIECQIRLTNQVNMLERKMDKCKKQIFITYSAALIEAIVLVGLLIVFIV